MVEPIILALTLGAAGQACRALVGLKKLYDMGNNLLPRWDWTRFLVSVALGATAGLAGLAFSVEPAFLWAAGYAGADALEGFARKAG